MRLWLRLMWLLIWLMLPGVALAQTAGDLQNALLGNASVVANCPSIVGVNMADPADTSTWTVDFATTSSPTCNGNVASVIASFAAPSSVPATLQITSTGTPSLNGTYSISPIAQTQITNTTQFLQLYSGFPSGSTVPGSTIAWPDIYNNPHTFNATSWKNFSAAVSNFVFSYSTGSPQSSPVTIP